METTTMEFMLMAQMLRMSRIHEIIVGIGPLALVDLGVEAARGTLRNMFSAPHRALYTVRR